MGWTHRNVCKYLISLIAAGLVMLGCLSDNGRVSSDRDASVPDALVDGGALTLTPSSSVLEAPGSTTVTASGGAPPYQFTTTRGSLTIGEAEVVLTLSAVGSAVIEVRDSQNATAQAAASVLPPAASECRMGGWTRLETIQQGETPLVRHAFFKSQRGPWSKGVVIFNHGGGGNAFHGCDPTQDIKYADFVDKVLADGYSVLLPDALPARTVRDINDAPCGGKWDAHKFGRPSLDLPFFETILDDWIPEQRPAGSHMGVFMTGISSGGFMTIRAATHFNDRITAFASVAGGDPYGTYSFCSDVLGTPIKDNETDRKISQRDSCESATYPNETEWDTADPSSKPPYKRLHHQSDLLVDYSCSVKLGNQIAAHGYPSEAYIIDRLPGPRTIAAHLWQAEYDDVLLEFFGRIGSR